MADNLKIDFKDVKIYTGTVAKSQEGVVVGVHKHYPNPTIISFDCGEATTQLIKDYEDQDNGCCGSGCGENCVG